MIIIPNPSQVEVRLSYGCLSVLQIAQKCCFSKVMVPPWCILNGGTVPPRCILYGGTVPPWCILDGGTVPPWCILNGGTVPPFNLFLFLTQNFIGHKKNVGPNIFWIKNFGAPIQLHIGRGWSLAIAASL